MNFVIQRPDLSDMIIVVAVVNVIEIKQGIQDKCFCMLHQRECVGEAGVTALWWQHKSLQLPVLLTLQLPPEI